MQIAEIYKSVQGEGFLTGTKSSFVRVAGCNLRCEFCDTPFASWEPTGTEMSVATIMKEVSQHATKHVVITGGEPMLFSQVVDLCEEVSAAGKHITIETAGTFTLPVICDLMSISPKLSNSTPSLARAGAWRERHETARFAPEVIRVLTRDYDYQFKFVVASPQDCMEIEAYLASFPTIRRDRVLMMPEGTNNESLAATREWLEPYCHEHELQFCPRMQIEWYGYARAT